MNVDGLHWFKSYGIERTKGRRVVHNLFCLKYDTIILKFGIFIIGLQFWEGLVSEQNEEIFVSGLGCFLASSQ